MSGEPRVALACRSTTDYIILHIREGKGAKARLVPLDDEFASDLKMHLGNREAGLLFISNKGNQISFRATNDLVAHAGERANVHRPNPQHRAINPHPFHHTFTREWKKRGGDIESLSEVFGHRSVAMTIDLYGTKSVNDLHENYRRVVEGG